MHIVYYIPSGNHIGMSTNVFQHMFLSGFVLFSQRFFDTTGCILTGLQFSFNVQDTFKRGCKKVQFQSNIRNMDLFFYMIKVRYKILITVTITISGFQ